jgi:hypothetical protein
VVVVPDERLVLTITDRPAGPQRAATTVELSASTEVIRMRFAQEMLGCAPEQQEAVLAGRQSFLPS